MNEPRRLHVGPMKLATVPGVEDGDLTMQMASGFDREGTPVVMLRCGPAVIALTIEGAITLGDALKVEAAVLSVEVTRREN